MLSKGIRERILVCIGLLIFPMFVKSILSCIIVVESREVVKGLQTFPLSPKVMQLTWKDPHVSPSVLVTYHVYHSVHNQVKYCGNTTHKAIKCSGLKPYTKYIFYVRRNMEEFNATISNYTDEDSK